MISRSPTASQEIIKEQELVDYLAKHGTQYKQTKRISSHRKSDGSGSGSSIYSIGRRNSPTNATSPHNPIERKVLQSSL